MLQTLTLEGCVVITGTLTVTLVVVETEGSSTLMAVIV